MNDLRKYITFALIAFFLTACNQMSQKTNDTGDYGQQVMTEKIENRDINLPSGSTILDENKSGFSLSDIFGGSSSSQFTPNSIAFNVALDKLSFMPLISVDVSSGMIVTDWYSLNTGNERIKINVRIIDQELNNESVSVTLFKQTYDGSRWVDQGQDDAQALKIKESILKAARSLQTASQL